jgi:hypothetical protein
MHADVVQGAVACQRFLAEPRAELGGASATKPKCLRVMCNTRCSGRCAATDGERDTSSCKMAVKTRLSPSPSEAGRSTMFVLGSVDSQASPVLVRAHSECLTGDVMGSHRCGCRDQLELALEAIGQAGTGILLYLRQEGRGSAQAAGHSKYQNWYAVRGTSTPVRRNACECANSRRCERRGW